jgi:hypothetical protein
LSRIFLHHLSDVLFTEIKLVACSVLMKHYSCDAEVLMPDLPVHVSVVVCTEQVEVDVDSQDWVAHRMVELSLKLLPNMFVLFEKRLLRVKEIKRFLVFELLAQDFNIKTNELPVALEVGLFHQLQ